jgi:ribosomal protein L11
MKNPKKTGEDIAKATAAWKGLRITVKLVVKNRNAEVFVVPSVPSMIIQELKEPPRDRKKTKNSLCYLICVFEDYVITLFVCWGHTWMWW